jgi:hypothetical protein
MKRIDCARGSKRKGDVERYHPLGWDSCKGWGTVAQSDEGRRDGGRAKDKAKDCWNAEGHSVERCCKGRRRPNLVGRERSWSGERKSMMIRSCSVDWGDSWSRLANKLSCSSFRRRSKQKGIVPRRS